MSEKFFSESSSKFVQNSKMSENEIKDFPQLTESLKLCQSLQSADKKVRRLTLVAFGELLESNMSVLAKGDFHEIFRSCHIYIMHTMRDRSEQVREQALKFLRLFLFRILPLHDYYLSFLFPILVERIGSVEIVEESEELRLRLMQFLYEMMSIYQSDHIQPFINDFITILKQTVQDKYPSVKEYSCKCISKLAHVVPETFRMQAITLVKPVLRTFGHQRYRIRVEGIKCIGDIVMHADCKALEDSVHPLAERLFDPIPLVRQTICSVVGRWMLDYRERYSYFHKLLPIILTGLNDEVGETRAVAYQFWMKVGFQYGQENERDLKNQMDYLNAPPLYYPEGLQRPNLGCRVLVQRNVGKLSGALARELCSWQGDVRVRCSQLLCSIAQHAEEGIIQHLPDLLVAMYTAARDEDQRVVVNVVRASEIMSVFVSVSTWLQLIIPVVEGGPHYGHLMVLAAFIRGSPGDCLVPHLEKITCVLADSSVLYNRKPRYQMELMQCARAVQVKYTPDAAGVVGQHLFAIIVTLISVKAVENTDISDELLDDLQLKLGLGSQYELWHKYVRAVLVAIKNDPGSWSESTYERCIFDTALVKARRAFGEHLDLYGKILAGALHKDVDPESRLKTFVALSTALEEKDVIFANAVNIGQFIKLLIKDVFVPSLIWSAGRTAEAMRTVAAACLASALSPCNSVEIFETREALRALFEELLPLLMSLAEDADYRSRHLALENLVLLKEHLMKKADWEAEDLIKVYPEVLKRLDDPVEKVRICAAKSLKTLLERPGDAFKSYSYRSHHELIIDTLFTHFDDDESSFCFLVFDVLKEMASINGGMLKEKSEKYKPILRNQDGCADILKYLGELYIS